MRVMLVHHLHHRNQGRMSSWVLGTVRHPQHPLPSVLLPGGRQGFATPPYGRP